MSTRQRILFNNIKHLAPILGFLVLFSCSQSNRGSSGPTPGESPASPDSNKPSQDNSKDKVDSGAKTMAPIADPGLGNIYQFCVQTLNLAGSNDHFKEREAILVKESKKLDPCDAWFFQEAWSKSQRKILANDWDHQFKYFDFDQDSKLRGDATGIVSFIQKEIKIESTFGEAFHFSDSDALKRWFRERLGSSHGFGLVEARSVYLHEPILLVNLETNADKETIRVAQVLKLVQYLIKAMPFSGPLVIGGDLKADSESVSLSLLKSLLVLQDSTSHRAAGSTDYILFHSSLKSLLSVDRSEQNLIAKQGTEISDHSGLRTNFSVNFADAKLLATDSQEFKRRITSALKSLAEARKTLENAENPDAFKKSLDIIEALEKTYRSPGLDASLLQYLRLTEIR